MLPCFRGSDVKAAYSQRCVRRRTGRAEVRLGRIPELRDQRMGAQVTLDGRALHALAAPVNQAHDVEAGVVRGLADSRRRRRGCRAARRRADRSHPRSGSRPARHRPQRLPSSAAPSGLRVVGGHLGRDAAARGEVADHRHAPRLARGDEVVEDLVGRRLVEDALVAIAEQVVLQRLQLEARADRARSGCGSCRSRAGRSSDTSR